MKKIEKGGTETELDKEKNKATKIGSMPRTKNGNRILKFISTAESKEGMGISSSHAYACCIRAKKTTAIARPVICIKTVQKVKSSRK